MKKTLSSLLGLMLILTPGSSIFAEQDTALLTAIGNLAKLENASITQSFSGRFDLEEDTDKLSASYRFTVNSATDNDDSPSSFNRITAFLRFYNHNEPSDDGAPFRELTLNATGEVIVVNEVDLYYKLSSLSIDTPQATEQFLSEIADFRGEADEYMNEWTHEQIATLTAEQEVDLNPYLEFEDQLKDNPEEAVLELAEQALWDSHQDFTEGDIEDVLVGVSMLLEAKLFNQLDIISGSNEGFTFFALNRPAVIKLAQDLGSQIGEPLSEEDESFLRSALSNISLSGIYRTSADLLDNFVLRLKITEMSVLKNFEFGYRFKLLDSEAVHTISAPEAFTEY